MEMPETFEKQVQECLSNLYDIVQLQSNPLAQSIAPDVGGLRRVQAVRERVIDLVEHLRPTQDASLKSKKARSYNILLLRYIEEQTIRDVMYQLALSERQYYREHRNAIKAITQVIWDQLNKTVAPHRKEITVATEAQLANVNSQKTAIDASTFLLDIIAAINNLATQNHFVLENITTDPLQLKTDLPILRQTLLWIITRLIIHHHSSGKIQLSAENEDAICNICINVETDVGVDVSKIKIQLKDNDTLEPMLQALDTTVSYTQSSNQVQIKLSILLEFREVLIIDDNPDALDLLTRYMADSPYKVFTARDAEQGIQLAQAMKPWIVVLDVMLPKRDGWEVLQTLKNHPSTRHIPVLICSVLENPELAYSLGATAFLKKPPDRLAFLEMLNQLEASSS